MLGAWHRKRLLRIARVRARVTRILCRVDKVGAWEGVGLGLGVRVRGRGRGRGRGRLRVWVWVGVGGGLILDQVCAEVEQDGQCVEELVGPD